MSASTSAGTVNVDGANVGSFGTIEVGKVYPNSLISSTATKKRQTTANTVRPPPQPACLALSF